MESNGLIAAPSDIPVAGGTLRVLSFGSGPQHVLAIHGITANATCWRAVARALPGQWTLHAVDLRGRGHSAELPGPYGFDQHASDLRDVVAGLGLDRPLLTGHSLGAYVALLTADAYPGLFSGLMLLDGGLPMPVPGGVDLDQLLAASLGPAIARLSETYPSAGAYVDFWRAHPALADSWNDDIEEYVRYDLTGEPGALRSRVTGECVRTDGRDLLASGERFGAALHRHQGPLPLLRAPRGMFGEPPGLLPEEIAAHWEAEVPGLSVTTLPDTNHYTMMFAPGATAAIAEAITKLGGGA
jgi:pimeloyl-ACP methyl ester carboxylesterase